MGHKRKLLPKALFQNNYSKIIKKNSLQILVLLTCLLIWACDPGSSEYRVVTGSTMGTYYRIVIEAPVENIKVQVDSLLVDINNQVSTYIPTSYISVINSSDHTVSFADHPEHFYQNLKAAYLWYEKTEGFLDVSIMPLVNYWGFGYTDKESVQIFDSLKVDSLLNLVGLNKWIVSGDRLSKHDEGAQLDFSSIAKGYAVDKVVHLLKNKGIQNFLVDIGGEGYAFGQNNQGRPWTLGISTPDPEADLTDIALKISVYNMALASSGNYRNYHEKDGRKYGHTISPITGFPYQDELLAVSILAEKCIDADAIATACMAMGYSKATTFIENFPEISACFLIGADDGSIQTVFFNGFIHHVIK